MGIVFPSASVASRWDGALLARLRRAPLENFLRARAIAIAGTGVAQDSENLARATVLIVEEGLSLYMADRGEGLAFRERTVVAHVACLVSRALAELISQPTAWRIAALVSTARLLSPWIGLNAAAMASASSVRQFEGDLAGAGTSLDRRVSESACAAINQDSVGAAAEISAIIALRLRCPITTEPDCSAKALPVLQGGA